MSAKHEQEHDRTSDTGDLRRRDFVALSVATGVAATSLPAAAIPAGPPVVEKNVTINTPDGTCDAAYFHPAEGKHPAVILWTDAFGLRPSMRDMGRRLAADGYAVLVPNPFYRVGKGPFYETAANVDFKDKATFAKIGPLMGSIGAPGAAEKDAVEFVKFLDAQPEVDKGGRSARRATAWAARWCCAPPRRCRSASAPARRSTAAASSPTSPTRPTCSRRRSRPAC
jgi:carboxymethylenebutenolidase